MRTTRLAENGKFQVCDSILRIAYNLRRCGKK